MGNRVKKGKVMNKVRPVNSRNAARRQKRIQENKAVLRSSDATLAGKA